MLYGKIDRKELYDWFLDDDGAKATAKQTFGDKQPNIFKTGYYSAPSWNWGYSIGIVGVDGKADGSDALRYFEVVTQFGAVVAAKEIHLPKI